MTAVAPNYKIEVTKVTTDDLKVDGVQSAEVDAVLETLKDEKFWKSLLEDKDKILRGAAPAPAPAPAPGVGFPIPIPIPLPVFPSDSHGIDLSKWAAAERNREFVSFLGGLKWSFLVGTIYALLIDNKDCNHKYTSGAAIVEFAVFGKKLIFWVDIIVK